MVNAHQPVPSRFLTEHGPVIPVIVIDRLDDALALGEALLEGGIKVFEVTLRTQTALKVIECLRQRLPEAVVGAGTVCNEQDVAAVIRAGAQFAVSPGYLPEIGRACVGERLPLLPGVATASEVMRARSDGFDFLKLFPAQAVGGVDLLKAWFSPFPDIGFCPTGGIQPEMASRYLALPNVLCVGGSWMVSSALVKDRQWGQITALARQASMLRQSN